jgi:prepilin-type N-terminal cleavage/methylation domain-containing protein
MADRVKTDARRRGLFGDDGFTLIESITAATVLLVIAAAVITTLVTTADWYAKARVRTEAKAVAERVMTLILARNYEDIHLGTSGQTWADGAIPELMGWPSSVGTLSVETSMAPQTDPATGLPVTQVVVTATPIGRNEDIHATVIRFASGWQRPRVGSSTATVAVEVQIMSGTPRVALSQSGARVQLLNTSTMRETYYAVTNSFGVARFDNVEEGQYFLTSDPRFGTDIRPVHFPTRVYPTRSGSSAVVKYSMDVIRKNTSAILSVGAFENEGFHNPQLVLGRWNWDVVKPYKPVVGLVVYARPLLNVDGTGSGIVGADTTYPTESLLGPYAGTVNAYGVAHIEIPWTVDTDLGQRWTVWCTTVDKPTASNPSPSPVKHQMADFASGDWGTPVDQADLMDQGNASKVPQFIDLLNQNPVNIP